MNKITAFLEQKRRDFLMDLAIKYQWNLLEASFEVGIESSALHKQYKLYLRKEYDDAVKKGFVRRPGKPMATIPSRASSRR